MPCASLESSAEGTPTSMHRLAGPLAGEVPNTLAPSQQRRRPGETDLSQWSPLPAVHSLLACTYFQYCLPFDIPNLRVLPFTPNSQNETLPSLQIALNLACPGRVDPGEGSLSKGSHGSHRMSITASLTTYQDNLLNKSIYSKHHTFLGVRNRLIQLNYNTWQNTWIHIKDFVSSMVS